jgi:TonB family protein
MLTLKLNHFHKFSFLISLLFHIIIIFLIALNIESKSISKQLIKINISNLNHFSNNITKTNKSSQLNSNNSAKLSKNNNQNNAYIEPIFDAKYLNNPIPNYPINARSRGIEGKVLLQVLVSKTGEPLKIIIYASSGSNILDESAFETVSNWRFVPAIKGDQAIEAVVIVPIEFKLS